MLSEFKEFALKGNVVDLAVGVIIGTAFGKLISSAVDDLIMPVVGFLTGGVDFTNMFLQLSGQESSTYIAAKAAGATVGYGAFITLVINFLIVAWILFMIVKGMNSMKKAEAAAPSTGPTQEALLEEIRDLLAKR
jgi:large conductance mechanosensitive channel